MEWLVALFVAGIVALVVFAVVFGIISAVFGIIIGLASLLLFPLLPVVLLALVIWGFVRLLQVRPQPTA